MFWLLKLSKLSLIFCISLILFSMILKLDGFNPVGVPGDVDVKAILKDKSWYTFAIKSNIETTQELIAHFKEFMKEVFKKNKSLQSKFQNIPNDQKLKMFSVNK